MLRSSFGAGSFAGFWRHWNPIFGFVLGRYVYQPLQRVLPRFAALLSTFVVCGAVHDLVTTLVRGSPAFLFTPWFFFLGAGVIFGNVMGLSFSGRRWWVRAGVNFLYLVVCLGVTLWLKEMLVRL